MQKIYDIDDIKYYTFSELSFFYYQKMVYDSAGLLHSSLAVIDHLKPIIMYFQEEDTKVCAYNMCSKLQLLIQSTSDSAGSNLGQSNTSDSGPRGHHFSKTIFWVVIFLKKYYAYVFTNNMQYFDSCQPLFQWSLICSRCCQQFSPLPALCFCLHHLYQLPIVYHSYKDNESSTETLAICLSYIFYNNGSEIIPFLPRFKYR